jgi:hypothetical protein
VIRPVGESGQWVVCREAHVGEVGWSGEAMSVFGEDSRYLVLSLANPIQRDDETRPEVCDEFPETLHRRLMMCGRLRQVAWQYRFVI